MAMFTKIKGILRDTENVCCSGLRSSRYHRIRARVVLSLYEYWSRTFFYVRDVLLDKRKLVNQMGELPRCSINTL
jgi:hypothetical protein